MIFIYAVVFQQIIESLAVLRLNRTRHCEGPCRFGIGMHYMQLGEASKFDPRAQWRNSQ